MEKSTFEKKLSCTDCRFSDKMVIGGSVEAGTVVGNVVTVCRYNPPIVAYAFVPTARGEGTIAANSLWPQMTLGDWCGKLETRAN